MKITRIAICVGALWAVAGHAGAQVISNLINDSTVRAAGSYSYYARGSTTSNSTTPAGGIAPFTSLFYMQETKDGSLTWNGLYGASSNAAAVAFATGALTDGSTSTRVAGIQNVNQWTSNITASDQQTGTFDILLNLGSLYTITSVVLTYTDAASHRWTQTVDGQSVFTSITAPTSDASLTLFGTQTVVGGATNAAMTFTPVAPQNAQYVDLRLLDNVTKSGLATTAYGGYLSDVAIFGYVAVPEPSAVGLMLGAGGLALICRGFRRRVA